MAGATPAPPAPALHLPREISTLGPGLSVFLRTGGTWLRHYNPDAAKMPAPWKYFQILWVAGTPRAGEASPGVIRPDRGSGLPLNLSVHSVSFMVGLLGALVPWWIFLRMADTAVRPTGTGACATARGLNPALPSTFPPPSSFILHPCISPATFWIVCVNSIYTHKWNLSPAEQSQVHTGCVLAG
jgi:hypothetical protein